jgi:hypothetical protein
MIMCDEVTHGGVGRASAVAGEVGVAWLGRGPIQCSNLGKVIGLPRWDYYQRSAASVLAGGALFDPGGSRVIRTISLRSPIAAAAVVRQK